MRRVFAGTMLCLLLLLSVGAVRCEAQCAAATMPMAMQASPVEDMSMDAGMEHCGGMQPAQDGMPIADAVCDTSLCHHHVMPAAADSRLDADTQLLQPIVLSVVASVIVMPPHRIADGVAGPLFPQRSPLDRSSSLRV